MTEPEQDYFLPDEWNDKVVFIFNEATGTMLDLYAGASHLLRTQLSPTISTDYRHRTIFEWNPNYRLGTQWQRCSTMATAKG